MAENPNDAKDSRQNEQTVHCDANFLQNSNHHIPSNNNATNVLGKENNSNAPLMLAVKNAMKDPKSHNEICFHFLKNADQLALSSKLRDIIFSNEKSDAIKQKRKKRLNKFDWSKSVAWQIICNQFGNNLNQKEILSIAELLSRECGVFLSSEAKNRKELLIQWFDENWENVRLNIRFIRLKNKDKENISKDKDP